MKYLIISRDEGAYTKECSEAELRQDQDLMRSVSDCEEDIFCWDDPTESFNQACVEIIEADEHNAEKDEIVLTWARV